MVAGLFGSSEIDLGIPAPGQLFDRGNIHGPVMKVVIDRGQEFCDEGPIHGYRVTSEWRLASARGIFIEVLQNLGFGFGEGDAFGDFVDQPRTGVHFADKIVHAIEGILRGMDHQIHPFAEDI